MTDQNKGILAVVAVAAGSILLAFIIRWALGALGRRFRGESRSWSGGTVIRHFHTPIMLAIISVGFHAAFLMFLYLNVAGFSDAKATSYTDKVNLAFRAIYTFVVGYGLSALLGGFAMWYGANARSHDILSQVRVMRKIATVVLWSLVVVVVLGQFGYKISTLLAALGVAGLAAALAVQDILANLFAGLYIVADRSVRSGDYVRLDSGQEGFVDEVSWRNTRIRGWDNNMVLVPNAKLIKSVIVNYDLPQKVMSVNVYCGVGYDSDLSRVEKITLEVAKEVLNTVPGGVKDFEPVLRYQEFGDSNINFMVVLRAINASDQFLIKHEFIKHLHARYAQESINISYPVRVVIGK